VQCTDTSIEGLILSSEDYAVFSKKYWLNNEKKPIILPEHSQQLKMYLYLGLLWQDFINSGEYLKNQ